MNIDIGEVVDNSERMADAVNKLGLITHMVANYYNVCPHCLSIAVAEAFVEDEDEEHEEKERPQ